MNSGMSYCLRLLRPRLSGSTLWIAFALIGCAVLSQVAALAETPARPLIRSASEIDYPPFCIVDANGEPDGFAVELFRAALAAMGREATIKTGEWSVVKGWLERGEVDALPLVGRTPERESVFDFTVPYMTLHGAIVVRENEVTVRTLDDLRGKRVAVMKGDNMEEFLRREERGLIIETTPTFDVALKELSEGKHDAVVVQNLVALRLIQLSAIANLKIVPEPVKGFSQDFCFAVKEGDKETLALLNEGLALIIADGTQRRLYSKWFAAYELPSRRIVIGGDSDYEPFEYIDENGRPAGYTVALVRAIADEMGLDVEYKLGTWTEIQKALEDGTIDAVGGIHFSEQRNKIFDFTPPHIANNHIAVVRKSDGTPPTSLSELKGKRIIVQRDDVMHDYALGNGLENQLTIVVSQLEGLKRLSDGQDDCMLICRMTALHLIDKLQLTKLDVGRKPFVTLDYCIAVKKGNRALLAQFSEGLATLERNGEYQRIQNKHLGVYEQQEYRFVDFLKQSLLIIGPLVGLMVFVVIWNWALRRRVEQRTTALRESENALLKRLTYERLVSEISAMAVNVSDVVAFQNNALRYIGEHLNVSRAYVFEHQHDTDTMDNTVEWCGMNAAPQIANLKGVPASAVPFWMTTLTAGKTIRFSDIEDIPDEGAKEILRPQSVLSILVVPLFIGKQYYGFIGFDECDKKRDWPDEDVDLLLTMSRIITSVVEHDRIERDLRSSEEKFRSLFENMQAGACYDEVIYENGKAIDYRILDVNPAFTKIAGISRDQLVGRRASEIYGTSDIPYFNKFIDVAETGEPVVFEGFFAPLDKYLHFSVSRPGSRGRFSNVFIDITEKIKIENQIRESEEKFRVAFRTSPDAIAITRASDGGYVDVNDGFETMSGYARNEIIGKSSLEPSVWANPLDRQRVVEALQTRGTADNIEAEFVRKDGSRLFGLMSARLIRLQNEECILSITHDITERKRNERALRFANMIINRSPVVAFLWKNASGWPVEYVSENVEKVFGCTADDFLTGRVAYSSIIHPEDLSRVGKEVSDYSADPACMDFTHKPYRIVNPDGAIRWIDDWTSIQRNDAGDVTHYQGVVMDITERQQVEDKLQQSEETYRALVEGLPDVVMRFDREGRHLFVSSNVRNLVEIEPDAFIGKTHRELGFPDEKCKFWEDAIAKAFDSNAPFESEFTVDGEQGITIFNFRVIPETDEKGDVVSVLGISRNITEHRRAEKNYETLFNEMLNGFALHEMIYDASGKPIDYRFVAVNPAFEKMTGQKASDIVGRTVLETLPGTEKYWIDSYGKVALTGEPLFFENYAKELNKHFEVSAFRPAPNQFACIFEDVTERRQMEDRLRQREMLLIQSQRMSLTGGWEWNTETQTMTWTDETYRIHDMDPEEAESDPDEFIKTSIRCYDPADRPVIEGAFLRCIETSEPYDFEFPFTTLKGRRLWIRTAAQAQVRNGKVVKVLGLIMDITASKQAKEALADSEKKYRDLVEDIDDVIFSIDPNGILTYVSPASVKMMGYLPEEVIGKSFIDFVHPDDVMFLMDGLAAALEEESVPYEFRYITKSGEIRWARGADRAEVVNGQLVAVRGTIADITDRVRAEEQVRQSEEKYRSIFENASEAIFVAQDGKLVFANPATSKILGYSNEEITGAPSFAVFIHPDDRETVIKRHIRQMQGDNVPNTYSFSVLRKTGEKRIAVLNTITIQWDDRPASLNFMSDITEQIELESKEKENAKHIEHLNRVLYAVRDINQLIVHEQDETLLINAACEQLVRHRSYESALIVLTDVAGQPRAHAYKGMDEVSGEIESYIDRGELPPCCAKADGQPDALVISDSVVDCDGCPIKKFRTGAHALCLALQHGGRNFGFLSVSTRADADLNDDEIKLFEELCGDIAYALHGIDQSHTMSETASALSETQKQLLQSQKMESIGRLAGGIAHDFNNALNAIIGYSELTMIKLKSGDPLRGNVEKIKQAGERAAGLTRQLLAFSRKQMLAPVVVNVNDIVKNIQPMLSPLIGEDIIFDVVLEPALDNIKADPSQIEQVIMNLAVNARDAMPAGGTLMIETKNVYLDPEAARRHSGVSSGHYVMLAVSDTGIGMDKDTLDKLFEPFFTTKEVGKGTGLGLATVHGIVKQSGGYIWVYSELGQGSTFKIYFRANKSIIAASADSRRRKISEGTETVLVVEDEEMLVTLAKSILESVGYKVLTARNGADALKMIESSGKAIDLLLTDVVMPGMSGKVLAEQASALSPSLKILYMSGYTDNAIVHHGVLDAGIHFIEKPFTIEKLTRKVRDVLDDELMPGNHTEA